MQSYMHLEQVPIHIERYYHIAPSVKLADKMASPRNHAWNAKFKTVISPTASTVIS